jgi:predicted polyphosphate/ATP-dependent NAD kinase
MGGAVGLKGTDGQEVLEKAIKLGAVATAPERARQFLRGIAPFKHSVRICAYSGIMGQHECVDEEIVPFEVVGTTKESTGPEDTKKAALEMRRRGVDLLVFCGGDGTARDIMDAIDMAVAVLGVPAGVKVHSSVFAINPAEAARIAFAFLRGELSSREMEVVDIDEDAFREGRLSARLYGYLLTPFQESLMQGMKISSLQTENEIEAQRAIAKQVIEEMRENWCYIVGPGTTNRTLLEALGLRKTLLGVDIIKNRSIIAEDVNERQLLQLIEEEDAKIVVTPIGGQGYIFGRGNQQISSAVIRKIGKENIIVTATKNKLYALTHKRLLVDTGDSRLDEQLRGYIRVITGYKEETIVKVE